MTRHSESFILAIDQGTSGTAATLYSLSGRPWASADVRVKSYYPHPGWVEQDPYDILNSVRQAIHTLLQTENLRPGQIECMGFAHQGESLLLWDLETGQPVHNVMSWQCVRSAALCETLIERGIQSDFRYRTGLSMHPEWPATKVAWAVEHLPEIHPLLRARRLAYSQIDAWLMRQLTSEGFSYTDHSMASRSGFYNIRELTWDATLINLFHAEDLVLPQVVASDGHFGEVTFDGGWRIPWRGNLIDQASALLGQACIVPGEAKITYGTCAAFWYNLGGTLPTSKYLDTSVAWVVSNQPTYALVGETITAASAITWLNEKFKLNWDNSELSAVAQSVEDLAGLIFIPALSGLGSPFGAPQVRGTLYGLTAGVSPEHLLRAGLNAIAFSVRDMIEALTNNEGHPLATAIKADGGMSANSYLMQFQADILGKQVVIPTNREGTSAGIAFLAGLACGIYSRLDDIKTIWHADRIFQPQLPMAERERRYHEWVIAIQNTLTAYTH